MKKRKHTLLDAACWEDGEIVEFLDDDEFGGWGWRYTPEEVMALNIPLHKAADWYAVGYGSLVAVKDNGKRHGKQIAVWYTDDGWKDD